MGAQEPGFLPSLNPTGCVTSELMATGNLRPPELLVCRKWIQHSVLIIQRSW